MCVGWPEWIIYDQTHPVSTIQFVSRFFFCYIVKLLGLIRLTFFLFFQNYEA